MIALGFGLLLLGSQIFAVAEPSGTLTSSTLQTYGWLFSASGLGLMWLKVPPVVGKIWAIVVVILIAYVIGASQGWIT